MGVNNKIRNRQLVFTVKDRCRVCYTCVRECPCKAIKIINGQAEVINERCIGCGNCVNVCSQGAKYFLNTFDRVKEIISENEKVAACIAPSFPAEFVEFEDYRLLVGMIKKLGFTYVTEVAFGADLVANEYKKVFKADDAPSCIASTCPTIVNYVERYHPELVEKIAKICSPMVAMARVIKKKYGSDCKTVFIGPCFSKKAESDELDEMLTFRELRKAFDELHINSESVEPDDFDPPVAGRGAIFPISRGLLETIKMPENLFDGNVIVAEGNPNFQDAIKEFEAGHIENQHLELLACDGCIMGPGMTKNGKRYARRKSVGNFVPKRIESLDKEELLKNLEQYGKLDLSQDFHSKDQRINTMSSVDIVKILEKMGKNQPEDYLDCGACGYSTCWDHALAIKKGLAEHEMCLPYTIEKLHKYNDRLIESNDKLASMQKVLKQKEKLAGMGQLSAGIAHELNNPLGVVIMYSNILLDECKEGDQMFDDLQLIVEQANRCKKIVSGLLSFSRKDQVSRAAINASILIEKSIKAILMPDTVKLTIHSELKDPVIMLDEEQLIQVFSNLVKNAIEAMPEGGKIDIKLIEKLNNVHFFVKDSGNGIPQEHLDMIFEPFFTTKETGKGTGLGLPTIYGIIKMHNGRINVTSNCNPDEGPTGTEFEIVLPRIINS